MTRQFDKLEEVFLNNLMRVFHSIKKDRKKQFVGKDIYISASALFMPEKAIANRFSILIAVWQEVFDNNLHFNQNETIVNVWKDWGRGWKRTVYDVSVIDSSLVTKDNQQSNICLQATKEGYRVLLSGPWYLNYISYGSDWTKYYKIDPSSFGGDDHQQSLVLGGELCLWGEFVNSINALPRLW